MDESSLKVIQEDFYIEGLDINGDFNICIEDADDGCYDVDIKLSKKRLKT